MNNKYKYRFRTKKEFIRKFGEDWTNNVKFTWNNYYMDSFFGKDISDYINNNDIKNFEINDEIMFNYNGDNFRVGTDMIIKENLHPSYKPKKIVRKI